MSEQWETFCDECYYHMWRLRRKNERKWDDGFHINSKEEAEGLCKLLNKLEGELTEARELLDAERKHHWETTVKWNGHHMELTMVQCDLNKSLRELDDAKEQRDRLAEALREIVDCDFVITLPDRMDAVRAIAREALSEINWYK